MRTHSGPQVRVVDQDRISSSLQERMPERLANQQSYRIDLNCPVNLHRNRRVVFHYNFEPKVHEIVMPSEQPRDTSIS